MNPVFGPYAEPNGMSDAERIWLNVMEGRKVYYGDYANDLKPILDPATRFSRHYGTADPAAGYDPCELAEQIRRERGILANGDNYEGDVVEDIRWLFDSYHAEIEAKKKAKAVEAYAEQNGISHELADEFNGFLERKVNGNGKPKTHYRRAGEPAPQAALDAIRKLPKGTDKRAACMLMWQAGLRIAEALALTWADLQIKHSYLYVRRGKGDKSRFVPVSPELKEELRSLFYAPAKRSGANDDFSHDKILHISRAALQKWLARTLDIGAHQLRHSCGFWLRHNGLSIDEVAKFLGHANSKTAEIYSHLQIEDVGKKLGWED